MSQRINKPKRSDLPILHRMVNEAVANRTVKVPKYAIGDLVSVSLEDGTGGFGGVVVSREFTPFSEEDWAYGVRGGAGENAVFVGERLAPTTATAEVTAEEVAWDAYHAMPAASPAERQAEAYRVLLEGEVR